MRKPRKIGRKALTVLMTLAIVLTGLPQSLFTGIGMAEAANITGISGSLESKRLLDYEFKTSRYMQIYYVNYANKLLRNDGSCTEASSPMHVYNINTGEAVDPIVFCAEHGVTQKNTTKMNARNRETAEMTQAYKNAHKEYAIDNIFKVLFYGPVKKGSSELFELGFKDSRYYGNNGSGESDYTFGAWAAATQCLVWECQQDFRDKDFNRHANGLSYQTGYHGSPTSKIPADHYTNILKGTPAMDIYNFMASEIKKNNNFDKNVASIKKDKPTEILIEEDATFPYTKDLNGTGNGTDLEVIDDKDKVVEGITISFNKDTKKYTLTVQDESLLNKTLTVRHKNKAAIRAEKYTKGSNEKYYEPYFWGYATNGGEVHTQGFVSGLKDPTRGYFKLTKTAAPAEAEGNCEPLDVDVFPVINMPIEKVDANTGFDGNNHTPMGDAALDAAATLERQIGVGGAWETIDTQQFDDFGTEIVFTDQPFTSAEALAEFRKESGELTACNHPITDGEGNIIDYAHKGIKSPTKREWDVTVNYRITITRPDGRYIDPDAYGGVRKYTLKYKAETHDTCTYWCGEDPWTPVEYQIEWGAVAGAGDGSTKNLSGTSVTDGGPIDNEPQLDCDLETDVEDVFRGRFHLIKSNEKENPFKDSALGGSDSNMSRGTLWTIRLKSKGYEASEYVHLVSTTPTKLADGTNVYTVSRGPGVVNNEQNPIKVGTNGALLVEDLPYGEYIVTEVGTDDPMYVPEQFTVVVSEHNGDGTEARVKYQDRGAVPLNGNWANYNRTGTNGIGGSAAGTGDYYNNLYQVNLRNKIKSNQIQLQKVDSETGKIIRLAGTKVFIRYKGNPDYTDEQNREMFGPTGTVAKNIYNRFLPNAESIDSKSTNYTFELDENGCFDIPYQLPYGKYEIYEWLLPEGYYVGEYDETGTAKNHNFGFIDEGQFTVDADTHGYNGTVPYNYAIRDAEGNKVKYKDADSYSFENLTEMVTNRYTFTVTKQDMHVDGNYSELVTYGGNLRTDADSTYDKGDYPFKNYYKVAAVINNAVKGKIEIIKEGEALVGFKEEVKDGHTILTPVFETVSKIKDAVFGIFAAKDENLNDGSEGPAIYDSETGELITIPKTKSSHLSNAVESIKAFFGKLFNPKVYKAANYETGEYSHESGAELWYMLEREASEGNIKRTIYVTPEQKDTVYSYSYETMDEQFKYRYDVQVIMKNQAGGDNITDVSVTKVTSPITGYVTDIPLTYMTGSVGSTVLDPLDNYMNLAPGADPNLVSALDAYSETYTFEADGEFNYDWNSNDTDFSEIGARRYVVKDYKYYELTATDLVTEERVVSEDIKETKTMFEWDNEGWELVGSPAAGDKAILKQKDVDVYKAAVVGYYAAINAADMAEKESADTVRYTSLTSAGIKYQLIESDMAGQQILPFTVPEDWTLQTFTGTPKEDAQYVIIYQTDAETGETVYRVLLNDFITWQECTPAGNFVKATVQVYEVKYKQVAGDPDGFTLNWDGFALGSNVDQATNTATTIMTKHANPVSNEVIDVGAGYEYTDEGESITFTTIPITSPIYFAWTEGVKADAYYKGGVCYATISMPQSAVDYLYEDIVPTLCFKDIDGEGNDTELRLDWYSKLSPENPQVKFSVVQGLPEGCTVTATRKDSTEIGEETTYLIEIVTNQKEDKPLTLTFADGYSMDVYCATAASGNGVGVIDLHNVYKTTRYTTSELVDVITTGADGKAESKLLPLGDYIVRELAADDNYLNDSQEQLVELKYKDQFTPLIWGGAKFKNEYFSVQLDLSKVFETAFESGDYQPPKEGQTVKFGLYAAEDITATASGILSVKKKTIKADTLMDVITVDYTQGGSVLVNAKLPEGNYYIKELEAPEDYLMSDIKYNFVVREDDTDYSAETIFDYTLHDGIYGKFVLEEKNHVETTVTIESRFPMPYITIDGIVYPLDADFESENGNIKIDVASDFTTVTVNTYETAPTDITLPNGKTLKVKLGETGNTFDYTVDGVTKTFTPTVTYTGYYAGYEELWTPIAGEDLNTYTPEFTLTGAGADKASVILKAVITHEPLEGLIPGGNQIFKHSAVITVTETLDPSGEITLNPKDTLKIKTLSGAAVTVSMDKYGVVKASITNTLPNAFADTANSEVSTTGTFGTETFEFAKNVTLGRQDTSAYRMMIKINSDNRDGFAVENDHKPEVKFVKVDKDDHTKKLSGARFEIYSAKASGEWTVEPDQKIGEYTTGADGSFNAVLDYGTYFYREISAPSGYTADYNYHKFRVIKGLSHYEFEVENTKIDTPDIPGTPGDTNYLLEITKQDMETGATLAGAEFEIYGSTIVDGQVVRDEEPLLKNLVTGEYGKLVISLKTAGTYYYHETKAPAGYIADSEFLQIEIKGDSIMKTVTAVNERKPQIPAEPQKPLKPEKSNHTRIPKEPSEIPKTGDKNNFSLWAMLMLISFSALLAAIKRKEESDENI